ncbi:MAG: PRC-barrel domain-containing protein [Actinomycetota bacterium]|nr:PRC-barrel domain-containing protein [Actinomycetota bacterium]
MPDVQSVTGEPVRNPKGKRFGSVTHVLFHPSEPRVVGFEIQPEPYLYVIPRRPCFVALADVEVAKKSLRLFSARPASNAAAAKKIGANWENTVIWAGMPVRSESGEAAGCVRDVRFSKMDGRVKRLALTGGMGADVAIGRQEIGGDQVQRFDGEHVVVDDAVHKAEYSGGMARRAGTSAAVAKVTAEEVAKKTVAAGRAAVKVASSSKLGKRAVGRLKAFGRAARDAMSADEED